MFELERNGTPNRSVYQALGSHYLTGQVETFVTVLAPVPADDPVSTVVTPTAAHRSSIEALVEDAGFGCPVICTPEELMES